MYIQGLMSRYVGALARNLAGLHITLVTKWGRQQRLC